MRINNNLMAMNTHRQMGVVAGQQSKSMEKLSSGYRINRAGDDAAGLSISEKMRAQIRGLNQASRKCAGWYFYDPNCRRCVKRDTFYPSKNERVSSTIIKWYKY